MRMRSSSNYQRGAFVNREETPQFSEGYSMGKVLREFMFKRNKNSVPATSIPALKTDLHQLPADKNWLIWFGHSSYLLQVDGLRLLVDPVLSGNASPLPGTTTAFKGADIYRPADIPPVDYLLLSHDHYDHLDYTTVREIRNKVGSVICGLGVGAHLERWGYPASSITEMDWDSEIKLDERPMKLYALTARHFSGRSFSRNNTLWLSFLLETPQRKIYLGGDSGYGDHFKNIGERHGPIDLAILENGQYNRAWRYIHFLPGENLLAARDLRAQRLLPVHSGKFSLAMHDWNEPLREITRRNKEMDNLPLLTPRIGEVLWLDDASQTFDTWWEMT